MKQQMSSQCHLSAMVWCVSLHIAFDLSPTLRKRHMLASAEAKQRSELSNLNETKA